MNRELVAVRLLDVPVNELAAVAEHHDDLVRELALLLDGDEDHALPRRLLEVSEQVNARFHHFSEDARAELARAMERGDERIDVVIRIPADAREAALELDALLDEVDEYCRQSTLLLTVEAPPATTAVRKWYLHEFVRQIGGEPPTPWSPGA